jgi:probable F420-dependent oxidoreductase
MTLDDVGVWTDSFDGLPLREVQRITAELEEQGWPSLWVGEAFGRETFTGAGLLLGASRRMRIGSAITNIYGRDAVTCAAAARTLEAAHPGRFVLGLGVSHAPLVEQLRGHAPGSPVRDMTGYLEGLAAAPTVVPGEEELPPVVLAALGPRMIGLARDRARGVVPALVAPAYTAAIRERLGIGPRLVVVQAAVLTSGIDADEWRRRAHQYLNVYTGLPNYVASFRRQGFSDADLVPGGSEGLKQAMVPFGVDATLQRIKEHRDAGADEVLVQVLGEKPLAPSHAEWAMLARELR